MSRARTLANYVSSAITVSAGGTGAATHTANNVMIGAGTSALTSIAPGADGQVLTSTGSVWQSEAAGGIADTDHSVAQAWALIDGHAIPPSLSDSYNCSGLTSSADGKFALAFDTDMPDANYSWVHTVVYRGSGFNDVATVAQDGSAVGTSGTLNFYSMLALNLATSFSLGDASFISIAVFSTR